MARLSALIGICFMLVGVLSYTLPQQQEFYRLLPSFVGVLISIFGLAGIWRINGYNELLYANVVSCVMLLVYCVARVGPDLLHVTPTYTELIADLSVLGYALTFVHVARKQFTSTAS